MEKKYINHHIPVVVVGSFMKSPGYHGPNHHGTHRENLPHWGHSLVNPNLPIPPMDGEAPPMPIVAVVKIAGPPIVESAHENCSDPETPNSQTNSTVAIKETMM